MSGSDASSVPAALAGLESAVDAVDAAGWWRLSAVEQVECLERLEGLRRRVQFCGVQAVARVEDSGAAMAVGAPSTAALLRGRLRVSPKEAAARVRAARALCGQVAVSGERIGPALPEVAAAARAGVIGSEHVQVIGRTMRDLPADLGSGVRAQAEATLVDNARRFDPATLGKVGRHLRLRLAPAEPSPEEVARRRGLRFTDDLPGLVAFSGICGEADAATIRTALDPLAAPRAATGGVVDERTGAQRALDALVELSRRALDSGTLPARGGERPHLMLTITQTDLRSGGPGELSWAGPVDATTAATIACDAQITPIVLDEAGVPRRIGPATRTVPGWLRRSVIARDRGCVFPGCDRPAGWSEIHHVIPWQTGGTHHLENLALLCGYHHSLIHREHWQIRFIDSRPHLVPPPWIDPERTPLRNHQHHTTQRCAATTTTTRHDRTATAAQHPRADPKLH